MGPYNKGKNFNSGYEKLYFMKRSFSRLRISAAISFFMLFSGVALAQTVNDTIRSAHLSSAYASIINFSAEPDFSSSHLWIHKGSSDETQMNVTKFPLRHEFELENHTWKPMVQATLARLKIDLTLNMDPDQKYEPEWESYSATIGGGVRIPLSKNWSILPAIDAGYAHLKNEASYHGPEAIKLKPIMDGKLFDWNADAWLINGHLALFYKRQFGKLAIDSHISGTVGHIESYDTTHELQEFSETISTASIKIDGTYPLGISFANDPLFVVGHIGNSTILTDLHTDLGISSIYETGLSLQADITRHGFAIKKLGLGAMVLWGEDVIGWGLRTSYRF